MSRLLLLAMVWGLCLTAPPEMRIGYERSTNQRRDTRAADHAHGHNSHGDTSNSRGVEVSKGGRGIAYRRRTKDTSEKSRDEDARWVVARRCANAK